MRYHFRDLVDLPALQSLTDKLYEATSIPSAIISRDGEVLTSSGWQRICTDFHRKNAQAERECLESDTRIRDRVGGGEPFAIYRCPRGLVDASSPVLIEGEHVANVFAGQVFTERPDAKLEALFRAQAGRFGFDEQAYLEAFREVPVFPEERFRSALRFLAELAELIAQIGLARLRQRTAAEEARASEEKFKNLFENAQVGMYRSRLDGSEVLDVNQKFLEVVGKTREEVLGRPSVALWQDPREREEMVRRLAADGSVSDFECRIQNGSRGVRHCITSLRFYREQGILEGSIIDITDRKLAEEALRRQKEEYERILNAVPAMIWYDDKDGRVQRANEAVSRIMGLPLEAILGKTKHELFPAEHADRFLADNRAVMESGRTLRFEEPYTAQGGERRWARTSKVPFCNSEGQTLGVIAVVEDITEQKRAEEERGRLEEQLRHAQKMEAIGTLAGGIAHDFNNILTPIVGHGELALMRLPKGDPVREDVSALLSAAERAADLVRQILSVSRKEEPGAPVPVDVGALVKETAKLLRASIPATIELRVDVDPGCGSVLAAPSRLQQVILNLCTNASYAMAERGGVLTVSLRGQEAVGGVHRVRLAVSDTGPGIAPDVLPRIFEPYFTTKPAGKGSGLGLAVVHGIVTTLGGEIRVSSPPGEGATFEVVIPEAAVAGPLRKTGRAEAPQGTGQHVLVVDDERGVAEVLRRMLEALGYRVTYCAGGPEALAVFRAAPGAFEAVITDYTMPGMTGLDLAGELLHLLPELPVFLATGFAEGVDERVVDERGLRGLVTKPYSIRKLGRALDQALGGRTAGPAEGQVSD